MREKSGEMDMEIHFKDAFRAFSKDDEGGHRRYLIWCCISINLAIFCFQEILLKIYIHCTSNIFQALYSSIYYF